MSTNMDILRGKMAEKKISVEDMAKAMGINASTFYRKMKADGSAFTVGQIHQVVNVLGLSHEEATSIFLW